MSADQITPERPEIDLTQIIKNCRESVEWANQDPSILVHDPVRAVAILADALDGLNEKNDSLRAEVQRLTEESRRSDAGRVEVPDRAAWLTIEEIAAVVETGAADYKMDLLRSQALHIARLIACASMDKGSRLSPSPQPTADVVVVPSRDALIAALGDLLDRRENAKATISTCMDLAEAEGLSRDSLALAYLRNVVMAQPKRETIQTVNALRSSTKHDAQDAGEGR